MLSNDSSGNLTDQRGTPYSGTVDSNGAHFTPQGSSTASTGVWIGGSNQTTFAQTAGALSGFNFTFTDPGLGQTLRGEFTFSGTQSEAEGKIKEAGFARSPLDEKYNALHGDVFHFRTPGQGIFGVNSAHVILSKTGSRSSGDFHFGEIDPRKNFPGHFVRDVIPLLLNESLRDIPTTP